MPALKLSIVTLIALIASSAAAAPGAKSAPKQALFKHQSVDAAWSATQKSKRPMLLFVSSNNCHYCVKMLKETYSHPQIAAALAATSETVAVNKEQSPELIKKLGVRAFPTTIVLSPEGKELARVEGYLDAKNFAARMFRPASPRQAVQPARAAGPRR